MERTKKRVMEYKVKDIVYTVSKDNLAEAKRIFGDSLIAWKPCHETKDGVAFFLDICELLGIEYIPDDLLVSDLDSRNFYFSLCDAIQVIEVPDIIAKEEVLEVVEDVEITTAEETETTVIDIEVLEVPETIRDIVKSTNEEVTEVPEEIQNNNKEGNTMEVNFEEILEETAKETAEEVKGERNMKDSTKKIEEATNDAKEKVSEAMASIGKYVDEFKINANKIAKMSDKQVYEYVMDRIDAHILMFSNWSGNHFTAIKEALEQQRSKIKKAVKKAEDAVDESDFDDETKESLFQDIKAFLGQVIKSVLIVAKAAIRFSLRVAGIMTTLGYKVIRSTITETISAGKAIGYAANDVYKEIKEGFSKDEYSAEEEYYDDLAEEYEEFTVDVETVEA